MDYSQCSICNGTLHGPDTELVGATWLDTSGGAFLSVCPTCRRRMETWRVIDACRCVICGELCSPRRSEGILFHDGDGILEGCDRCRIDVAEGQVVPA